MKAAAFVLGVALAASAAADEAVTHRLRLRQATLLDAAEATAAWAVDPSIAEVSIRLGRVTVLGRSPGRTVVSVATPSGVRTYEVVVEATPARTTAAAATGQGQRWTAVQGGYDSATARATTALDLVDRSQGHTRRLQVTAVASTDRTRAADAPVSLPSATIEFSSPRHSLVLFDRMVDHSPLTLDGIQVRGLHVRSGPVRLHAGYAASLLYDDLILSASAERVAGLGLALGPGRWTVTPAAFFFPDSEDASHQGLVGSLAFAYGRETDPFRVKAEAGHGGRWGGSGQLAFDTGTTRLRLEGRYQPRGFSALRLGRPPGAFAEAAWTATAGRLSLAASGSLGRYDLPLHRQRSDAASGTARLRLGESFFLTGGAALGWFDSARTPVRTLSVPAGAAYEGRRAGLSLLYRYQESTARNRGGSGGRLGLRLSGSRLRASAFVDAQREAPTVDFVLASEPRLARLLAELGLSARSPEDIARILADNAALLGAGYLEGMTVSLNPWRVQGGGDLVWSFDKGGRQQLRLRALVDRTRTVAGDRDTTLATLSYSRFVAGAELTAAYTWTASDSLGLIDRGSSVQLSVRKRFDGLPGLSGGGDDISGIVFADDEAAGSYAPGMPPLAGARVRLDGARVADTDGRGRFRFAGVGPGAHTVEALLPAGEGAFFTTASSVTAAGGAALGFGLGRSPARLGGHVRDDAGRGVAGITVRLQREGRVLAGQTDSSGRYAFATAEGRYVLAVDAESLPAGYDAAGLAPVSVELRRARSERMDLVVPAQRALSGRVLGPAAAGTLVHILELGRTVEAAADGAYAFRNLKPGTYTVNAVAAGRKAERRVRVPEGPGLVSDVDLDPAMPLP